MSKIPDKAFILAAGEGRRLRPYTDTMPKPMVPARGRAIIDHTLDALLDIGVTDVTINLHYRAAQLQNHLLSRKTPQRLTFSFEQSLLDTGGGIKKALYTMGDAPFFVFSGDTLWDDGPSGNALTNLAAQWKDSMDLLLMLFPARSMVLTTGSGDYDIVDGQPRRNHVKTGAYFWPSIRICHPRLFDQTPSESFSFLSLMDRAEQQGKLGGMVHDGMVYHISTPQDLQNYNAAQPQAARFPRADRG